MATRNKQNNDVHETLSKDLAVSQTRAVLTVVKQGSYDALEALLSDAKCDYAGDYKNDDLAPSGSLFVPNDWGAGATCIRLAECRLARAQGGRGVLTATVEATRGTCAWGLDFTEVTKDVRTWRQGAAKEERPDLAVIACWEATKGDTAHAGMYQNFEYFEGEATKTMDKDSATYSLADMILRGIENYSVWIPVVTCTATTFSSSAVYNNEWGAVGEKLGHVIAPSNPIDAFDLVGGVSANDLVEPLASAASPTTTGGNAERKWVMTADRLTVNADGSFTRVLQWTGFDSVEPNLYADAQGEGR